ncbi:carbohydrate ABC transporter permease [Amycolatopsis sp. cmx-4-61]|uniref:carbohydrate ABC transporter permease n=1 Tax=Amycolatopsis sp. cmx-4-61 TaxID=2790937 RepID=UPI00397ADDE3
MTARRVVRWTALAAATVLFLYPFVWLLSASVKPRAQVFDNVLLPRTWAWDNYVEIWQAAPVAAWLLNSVVVSLAAAVAVTLTSSLVAFGFAYFRFPGRNALFGLVLATMMLPGAVTMIPVYLIWNSAGLAHTQVPLWAGNLFGSAFYIFLLRQFFLGLPREVFEAARVDGASHWTLFWRIAVPLCRPALIVSFVFELKASWSDLLKPLIYLRDPALYTLPRGLKALSDQFGQAGEQRWEIVLAGSVITTVPLLIVFFLAQRQFLAGITTESPKPTR